MASELSIRDTSEGVIFDVLVSPRASRPRLGPVMDGRLRVAVAAPPVEGAANEAVVAALARALGVARRDVAVVAGHRGRRKSVRIAGLDRTALLARLGLAGKGTESHGSSISD